MRFRRLALQHKPHRSLCACCRALVSCRRKHTSPIPLASCAAPTRPTDGGHLGAAQGEHAAQQAAEAGPLSGLAARQPPDQQGPQPCLARWAGRRSAAPLPATWLVVLAAGSCPQA